MALWSHETPPLFYPNAVLTRAGWADPVTGELIVALNDDENNIGPGTGLKRRQYGVSRIQQTVPRELLGNARIKIVHVETVDGFSRIQTVNTQPLLGRSRLQVTTNRISIGRANVYGTTLQPQIGNAVVRVNRLKSITGAFKVVHRLNLSNLAAEYGFYRTADPGVVTDLTLKGHNGQLSSSATWTNLGLRMDGTQAVIIPDVVVPRALTDFTVFAIVQSEADLDSTLNSIFEFGPEDSGLRLGFRNTYGLQTIIQNGEIDSEFYPKKNVPFALTIRYYSNGLIDVRIAESSPTATNAYVKDTSLIATDPIGFNTNGVLGQDFKGTLIYFALFDRLLSNGEVGQLFRFSYNLLLVRGENPYEQDGAPQSFAPDTFQTGVFQ